MATTTIGTIQLIATIDTSRYKKGAKDIEKTNSELEGSTERTSKRGISSMSNFAKLGLGVVTGAAVAAGAAITKNIGRAVNRIDQLVAFPKVLQNLGVTADEAQEATDKLARSLDGLPTPLEDGTSGIKSLVSAGLDINTATDGFLALNNALLANDSSTQVASATMTQMTQALSRGRIEGNEWNTIIANMPTALQGLQESTGKSRAELEKMFKSNPQQLIDSLIELNTEGSGSLASLEKQARDNTSGIGTAWENMNNAISKGMQKLTETLGGGDLEKGQERITSVIDVIKGGFKTFFDLLADNEYVLGAVAGVIGGVLVGAIWALVPAIWAATAPLLPFVAAFAAIGALGVLIYKNWDKIKPVIDPIIDVFKKLWEQLKPLRDFVGKQLKNAWEDLKSAFEDIKKAVEPFLPQLKILGIILAVAILLPILAVVAGFVLFIGIVTAVIVIVARLIGWFAKLIAKLVNFGIKVKDVMTRFGNSVRNTISSVIGWFSRLPSRIINAVGNLGRVLYGAGRDLIRGFLNGAGSLLSTVGQFFIDKLPGFIQGPFKKALGIQSPSKVFAEYGKNITEGLAGGIDDNSSMAEDAINALSGDVTATMTPTVNASVLDAESGYSSKRDNGSASININLSGVMASSQADLRKVAKQLVGAIDEERAAKQQPLIMGAN